MKNLVFGFKAVLENVKNNKIKIVYCYNENDVKNKLSKFKNVSIEFKNKDFFKEFDNINHQYIIGVMNNENRINIFDNTKTFLDNIKSQKPLILMLDEVQDPGNFGAICRTSSALGVDGIIYKKNNQCQINETVIKTSVGAIYNLNFLRVSNLHQTIEQLKNEGYWILTSTLNEKSLDLTKFKNNFDKKVLVIGNEEKGVSKLIEKSSDVLLKINMNNSVQSLNVSVATGILLYELKR